MNRKRKEKPSGSDHSGLPLTWLVCMGPLMTTGLLSAGSPHQHKALKHKNRGLYWRTVSILFPPICDSIHYIFHSILCFLLCLFFSVKRISLPKETVEVVTPDTFEMHFGSRCDLPSITPVHGNSPDISDALIPSEHQIYPGHCEKSLFIWLALICPCASVFITP